MNTPISLRIAEPLFEEMMAHLFPGDSDEHGGVLCCGVVETDRGTRLLARTFVPAQDGLDYIPGRYGYRALTAKFVAEVSGNCASERLAYLAVHCHPGSGDSVAFSPDDYASHERGYSALLDIMNGGPVGALVFGENSVAGSIWSREGIQELTFSTVIGRNITTLFDSPKSTPAAYDPIYDRSSKLFGVVGQARLKRAKIGIIGAGGGGSLLNEWCARLGVGHIVIADDDRIAPSNLPRIVGATRLDAITLLTLSKRQWLSSVGTRIAKHKVRIAKRQAKRAQRAIKIDAIVGNVLDEKVAHLFRDCDFLFLASDTIQSRLVFNALVFQYLIPGAQVGAKVPIEKDSGNVGDLFTASRLVLPYAGGGCLDCHHLIPADKLQEEAITPIERRRQRYVEDDEVAEPSVLPLNVLSAAKPIVDAMLMLTGLIKQDAAAGHYLNFPRERSGFAVEPVSSKHCLDCSLDRRSRYARGDRFRLPCRQSAKG